MASACSRFGATIAPEMPTIDTSWVPHPVSFDDAINRSAYVGHLGRSSGWGTDGTPRVLRSPTRSAANPTCWVPRCATALEQCSFVASRPPASGLQSSLAWCPIPLASTKGHRTALGRSVEARGGGRSAASCHGVAPTVTTRPRPALLVGLTRVASPSSRVLPREASTTPGSAALHPGLELLHPLRGFLASSCRLSIDHPREAQ
jgi:hypothetical protein